MSTAVDKQIKKNAATIRTGIATRLEAVQGPRPLSALGDRMGCSAQQVSNMKKGKIPASYLWLYRLRVEEGIDLNWLIAGEGNGK